MSVDDLVAARRVEELPSDPAGARGRLEAAQYGTTYFSPDQVAHDLEPARAIVAAVEASWPGPGAGA